MQRRLMLMPYRALTTSRPVHTVKTLGHTPCCFAATILQQPRSSGDRKCCTIGSLDCEFAMYDIATHDIDPSQVVVLASSVDCRAGKPHDLQPGRGRCIQIRPEEDGQRR